MIELIRAGAERTPHRPVVISRRGEVTYAQLLDDAHRVAGGLLERGLTRIGALTPHVEDALLLYAAGSLAGVEVCGYPLCESAQEVDRLAQRFDHAVVVVGRDGDADRVPSGRGLDLGELLSSDGTAAVQAAPSEPTVMILTTGTTGERRGAIHRWSRLTSHSPASGAASDARWLLAYNTSQFAGIAVLLEVLRSGATIVQAEALQAPAALEAMSRFAVTHTSATPTFWRGVLRELKGVAPGFELRQITLGGEAVPARLVDELREIWPEARVSQIYAATEFGQTGSVRDGLPGLPVSVLERGADADLRLRVVDGELQVLARNGMLGYYGEPPVESDEWRRTGDLVEIRDGRLLFMGRTSEVINVGGVKVHPVRVEDVVEQVPGVSAAVAFGRTNALTGQIVAVEVVLAPSSERDTVDALIRAACEAALPVAARPRSIRYVTELATSGLKLNRRLARTTSESGSTS